MPVLAQITGAVALTALLVGPWWSRIPQPLPASAPAAAQQPMAVFPKSAAQIRPAPPESALRPAHLNLDVQHAFGKAGLSVTIDGEKVLDTTLEGSAKRFKVFGKRAARGFTRTLDLAPGVRVVSVRVRSTSDRFDQARVERFDLESAAVATLRVSADKSGLSVVAERPALQAGQPAPSARGAAPAAAPVLAASQSAALTSASASGTDAAGVMEVLQSLRSMLIAIAGFIASAATGFLVQEFLRSRRGLLFDGTAPLKGPSPASRLRPE
jgi:hypothetical protein